MSRILCGLILLHSYSLGASADQRLTQSPITVPLLKTESIELIELPGSGEGEHRYLASIPESFRNRHFQIQVDRTVCKGNLLVNSTQLTDEDVSELFRFDRSNVVSISECLERTPNPLRVLALPKVHIASAQAIWFSNTRTIQIQVRVRNALQNSVSCILTVAGHDEEFFVGPETSQTRSFSVRLLDGEQKYLPIELLKLSEALEDSYKHFLIIGMVLR